MLSSHLDLLSWSILPFLQLFPLLSALLVVRLRQNKTMFYLALGLSLVELFACGWLAWLYDATQPQMQLAVSLPIIKFLRYAVAVDGMTVLFMLLAAFLTPMVIIYSHVRSFAQQARFMALVLVGEAALMSQFASVDLLWFTLFSAIQTVLAGYMMHTWSDAPEEGPVLIKFYQFMGISLLLLLAGTILLGWVHGSTTGGSWRVDLAALLTKPIPGVMQNLIFFLLFYGLAIRIPIFPLHGWLPSVAEHGTVVPAMVFILGLKTGIYGLLRFVFPLLPLAVKQWHVYAAVIAVAGIFYAALLAIHQPNLRRMMAYAIVSHTSILVIGLFSLSPQSFQGSILLTANVGLAMATLFFMVGLVNRRTHTVLLPKLGGLFDHLPVLGIAFFVGGLSIVAMPGTPGFDAAHLILEAAIHRFGALITIAAALGNVASAAFILWSFQRVFLTHPKIPSPSLKTIPRANRLENFLAITVIAVQFIVGFYSEPWLALVEKVSYSLAAPYDTHKESH